MKPYSTCVVFSDIHIPFHDEGFVSAAIECIKDMQPEALILNGDVIDCYSISRFNKPLKTVTNFETEVGETKKFLKEIRKAIPKAEIVYTEGNHEFRLKKVLADAAGGEKQLISVLDYTMEQVLDLKSLNIKWADSGMVGESRVQFADVKIGHWDVARSKSGQSAQHLIERYAEKIVQGHVHRGALLYKRYSHGTVWGVENPCMTQIEDVDYCIDPNWFQGFTILREHKGVVHPQLVVVEQKTRSFIVDGKLYTCRDTKKKDSKLVRVLK